MAVAYTGDVITSRQNRRIVELMKLSDRRARESTRCFRFDGVKLLCEAMTRGVSLDSLFLRAETADRVDERMQTLYGCRLADVGCPVYCVEDSLFDRISEENAPEGVIAVAVYPEGVHRRCTIFSPRENGDNAPMLLLESVRDPLNVGAVIRSAAALGVGELILSADCADIYHPRTLRAAMGPLFSLPITRVEDMVGTVNALRAQGHRVYAAALDDTALRLGSEAFDADCAMTHAAPCAVIGNEGHGLSKEVRLACDRTVFIPMAANTESLNAGVAAALFMWELGRAAKTKNDTHVPDNNAAMAGKGR